MIRPHIFMFSMANLAGVFIAVKLLVYCYSPGGTQQWL